MLPIVYNIFKFWNKTTQSIVAYTIVIKQSTISLGVILIVPAVVTPVFLASVVATKAQETSSNKLELPELRTQSSKTFREIDESKPAGYRYITESYADKIHYYNGTSWQEVDNTIVASQSGNYSFANTANDFSVRFGLRVQDGMEFVSGNWRLGVGAVGVGQQVTEESPQPSLADREAESSASLTPIVNNSLGVVSGNKITYPEILPHIDLEYLVTSTGFRKQLVLKNSLALQNDLSQISFEIQQGQIGQQGYSLQAVGRTDIDLVEPYTFDLLGLESRLENFSLDNGRLTIFPDQGFLRSPERVFPVIIDPGVEVKSVTQDTFVSATTGYTPQGSKKPVAIGNYQEVTVPGAPWYEASESLLQFGGINQPVIRANLKLSHYGTTNGGFTADVRSVGGNWFDENSTHWHNRPGLGGDYGDITFDFYNSNSAVAERTSTDIRGLVNEQTGSGKVVLALNYPGQYSTWRGAVFCSKEGVSGVTAASPCSNSGQAPMLEYETNYPPAVAKPESPQNKDDFVGGCDQSVTPADGDCSGFYNINYVFSNINDGEYLAPDNRVQVRASIQVSPDMSTWSDLTLPSNWSEWLTKSQETLNRRTPDGRYYWRPILRDQYNATSSGSSTESRLIYVDTTPPSVPVLPELPRFSAGNQISITIPHSTDNIAGKIVDSNEPQLSYILQASTSADFADENLVATQIVNSSIIDGQVQPITFQVANLQDGQIYYYRVKAQDRIYNFEAEALNVANGSAWSEVQSSTQDAVLPVILDKNINIQRFSPSNPTSVGIKDEVKIDFEFVEKNFASAQVRIYKPQENGHNLLVQTLGECIIEGQIRECINSPRKGWPQAGVDSLDPTTVQFVWDGKTQDGQFSSEGPYILSLVVIDGAGQTNDLALDSSQFLVVLDDSGANLGLVSPVHNAWTNNAWQEFQGAVAGFNQMGKEDRDFDISQGASLEISKSDSSPFCQDCQSYSWKDITLEVDENKNFSHIEILHKGQNRFGFRTTDGTANQVTQVGDPGVAEYLHTEVVVNYETIHPEIVSISPNGLLLEGENNRNPKISFSLQDPDPTGDLSQTAGLWAGTNPRGYDISLLRSFYNINSNGEYQAVGDWQEIPLFVDGENKTIGNPKLAGDLVCQSRGSLVTEEVLCEIQLTGLQPDAIYQVFIRAKDKAGNAVCNFDSEALATQIRCNQTTSFMHPVADKLQNMELNFVVDSHTFLDISLPTNNSVLAGKQNLFEGRGELGSQVTIQNLEIGREIRFELTPQLPVLPAEYDLQNNLIVAEKVESAGRQLSFDEGLLTVTCDEFEDYDSEPNTPKLPICDWKIRLNQQDNFIGNSLENHQGQINQNRISIVDKAGNILSVNRHLVVDLYALDLSTKPNLNYISPNGDGRQDEIIFTNSLINSSNPEDAVVVKNYNLEISKVGGSLVRSFVGQNVLPPIINFDGYGCFGYAGTLEKTKIFDEQECLANEVNWIWLKDGEYTYTLVVETIDGVQIATLPAQLYAYSQLEDSVVITSPISGYVTTRGVINVQGQAPASGVESGELGFLRGSVVVDICVDTITIPNNISCDYVQTAEVGLTGFFSSIIILPLSELDVSHHLISAVARDNFGNTTPSSNFVQVILDTTEIVEDFVITPTFQGLNTADEIDQFLNGELSLDQIRTLTLKTTVSQNTQALDLSYADYTNLPQLPGTDSSSGYASIFNPSGQIAVLNNQSQDDIRYNPSNDPKVKLNQFPLSPNQLDPSFSCDQAKCEWLYHYPVPYFMSGGQYEVRAMGYKGESTNFKTAGFVLDGRISSTPRLLRVQKQAISGDYLAVNQVQNTYYTNSKIIRFIGVADPGSTLRVAINNEKLIMNNGESIILETVTNSFGLWQLDVTLPDNDQEYGFDLEASLNDGVTVTKSLETTKVVLDRQNLGLEAVQTSVPDKGVNPWVQTGDMVNFAVQTKENMSYCDLLKEDGFVQKLEGLGLQEVSPNPLNIGVLPEFVGSILINREEEGIYLPQIRCLDYAGNELIMNSEKLIMNNYDAENPRGWSLDFRLFIDNTSPDRTDFNTAGWGVMNGVYADGVLPETDRLVASYITRAGSVELMGWAEKHQRVSLDLIRTDIKQIRLDQILVSQTDCRLGVLPEQTMTDGLTVRFGEICRWSYVYQFKDNGQSPLGIASNWYLFQARATDLAGNGSLWSQSVTVYHDIDSPVNHNISNISSSSYNPVVGWARTLSTPLNRQELGSMAITKDTSVKIEHSGERASDIEYTQARQLNAIGGGLKSEEPLLGNLLPDATVDSYTRLLQNGFDGRGETEFALYPKFPLPLGEGPGEGTLRDQDRGPSCLSMHGNRRVGVCNDGLYSFNLRTTDSAGNKSTWVSRTIERDTVDPLKPDISLTKSGDILAEYLSLQIQGESNTTAYISLSLDGQKAKETEVQLDARGNYSTADLVGKLQCGLVNYVVKVRLVDRARNMGDWSVEKSIKTIECPRCTTTGVGLFGMPVRGTKIRISAPFGYYFDSNIPHYGVDFAGPMGTPIYAAAAGKVKVVKMGYNNVGSMNNPDGWANVVIIDHDNGLFTVYAHLLSEKLVNVGQRVSKGQLIGKMGSSGTSSGAHLHFQVEDIYASGRNTKFTHIGTAVNPAIYLGDIKGNLSMDQQTVFCPAEGVGNNQDANYNNHYEISELEAKNSIAWFIDHNLGGKSVLENSTGKWEKKTKDQVTEGPGDNIQDIIRFIQLKKECGVYYYDLQEIYNTWGTKVGFDGIIVANPYTNRHAGGVNAYLVKDEVWQKYQSIGKMCHAVGVPKGGPEKVTTSNWFIDYFSKNSFQRFENANENFSENAMYQKYWTESPDGQLLIEQTAVYFVVNNVALEYAKAGSVGGVWKFPTGDTYGTNYCKQWFGGGEMNLCSRSYNNRDSIGIEKTFYAVNTNQVAMGGDWDSENKISFPGIQKDRIRSGLDPNMRGAVFSVVSDDKSVLENYGGQDVFIVIHGWDNNPNDGSSWATIDDNLELTAQKLKEAHSEAIVMILNWKEASGACCVMPPSDVSFAAPWIRPVARQATQKLAVWGMSSFEAKTKLNLVGHSLGSLMSAEIARQFGGANTLVALDPPNDLFGYSYDIDGNTKGKQTPRDHGASYFADNFKYSWSFVGHNSVAGNHDFAVTTHQSFAVDFEDAVDGGSEHTWVIDVYNTLYATSFTQEVLNVRRTPYQINTANDNYGDFEGILAVTRPTDEAIQNDNNSGRLYLKTESLRLGQNNNFNFYANQLDNTIWMRDRNREKPKQIVGFGDGGSDRIGLDNIIGGRSPTRLQPNGEWFEFRVVQNGENPVIQAQTCMGTTLTGSKCPDDWRNWVLVGGEGAEYEKMRVDLEQRKGDVFVF